MLQQVTLFPCIFPLPSKIKINVSPSQPSEDVERTYERNPVALLERRGKSFEAYLVSRILIGKRGQGS